MPRSVTAGNDARQVRFAGASVILASALLLGSAGLSAQGYAAVPGGTPAKGNSPVTPEPLPREPAPKIGADSSAAPRSDFLALQVAERYGARDFHRVRVLQYVFRAKAAGKDIERKWTWFPKEDSVVYSGKDTAGLPVSVAYSRRNAYSMKSPAVQPIDKMFINDQYWLIFPMHLVWDKDLSLRVSRAGPASADGSKKTKAKGKRKADGAEEAWKLTVEYPVVGGYTPGDAYDLFVDSSGMVKRWVYRKGNTPDPTMEALWSEPVPVGPLSFSMNRTGMDGGFKLSFQDVRVDTTLPAP